MHEAAEGESSRSLLQELEKPFTEEGLSLLAKDETRLGVEAAESAKGKACKRTDGDSWLDSTLQSQPSQEGSCCKAAAN